MKLLALVALILTVPGCMMPNYNRLIPENKDFHGMIYNPIYGWAVLDTRVAGSTNGPLPGLPVPAAIPTPPPIASPAAVVAPAPTTSDAFYSAILEQLAEIRAASRTVTNAPPTP